jgi:UDP-N-acetyl-D-mannosaminuronic acid transferase (WecB/TagA/CpsF family)
MERHRNTTDLSYKQALLAGDFLLADGIALQLYKWSSDLERVDNLNGTDLTPWLLHRLTQDHSVSLYVYSTYDESIDKDTTRLAKGLDTLLRDFPALRIASSYQSHYTER